MSLIIYAHSLGFGEEAPYLQGTHFPSDPQFNYEPVVASIWQEPTHEAPLPPVYYAVTSFGQPLPPRVQDTPEPAFFWGVAVVLFAALLVRRIRILMRTNPWLLALALSAVCWALIISGAVAVWRLV